MTFVENFNALETKKASSSFEDLTKTLNELRDHFDELVGSITIGSKINILFFKMLSPSTLTKFNLSSITTAEILTPSLMKNVHMMEEDVHILLPSFNMY